MCLINFHFQDHPKYKLIIAANRDEFYERPTAEAHFWEDKPMILAGRDLKQMGTWLGISKNGRFAALTNFRDPSQMKGDKVSRGEIVSNYLETDISPQAYLESLHENKERYEGFNVLVGSPDQLFYYSNIQGKIYEIPSGTHGLCNHLLNTPWPKVMKGKDALQKVVQQQRKVESSDLFSLLSDNEEAEDIHLPNTGVPLELERKLSPLFIKTPDYGTRSSTILTVDYDNQVTFIERTYEKGEFSKENRFVFQIDG